MIKFLFKGSIYYFIFSCFINFSYAQNIESKDIINNIHVGHNMSQNSIYSSESTKEYEKINSKMHKEMNIKFSGNADIDFFKSMIPHHQAAIDMAEVVLKYGENHKTKKMAKEIIKAQKKEIQMMQLWLNKNNK